MPATTVRISAEAHRALREISRMEGTSMSQALEKVLEQERRRRILELANQQWAEWQADPQSWAEELAERKLYENTLADGLEDDPWEEG